jgi:hypothetical protein
MLTEAEKAAIDAAWAAEYGESGEPEPAPRASAAAIGKVLAKHHAATRQRKADEHALGRSLAAYPDELSDLALIRLGEMQMTPDLIDARPWERVDLQMGNPARTAAQARAEGDAILSTLEAAGLEAEAARLLSRVNRDADGNVVSVAQAVKVPEKR